MNSMDQKAPVFVKLEDYKDVIDLISLVRDKLRQARFLLEKINELKNQEEAELQSWQRELEDVERRVSEIHHALFEPEL